jgi:hypothetical protein
VVDELSMRAATSAVHEQQPVQTISARASIMHSEERSSQRPAVSSTRLPEDATRVDSQAGHGGGVSECSPSNGARNKALMITGPSRFSRLGQAKPQGDVRNQDVQDNGHPNGSSGRDLHNSESPFSRRVKEKLQHVQAHSEDSSSESSERTVELPISTKDAEPDYKQEVRGIDLTSFVWPPERSQ